LRHAHPEVLRRLHPPPIDAKEIAIGEDLQADELKFQIPLDSELAGELSQVE
jgi:hypothetical protein